MSRKRPARTGNPDLRQQKHVPAPPIEEIEKEIFSLLSPASFKTPTALPHIAALKQLNDAHTSILIFILIWALYDLTFIFPLLIMVAASIVFKDNIVSYLKKLISEEIIG